MDNDFDCRADIKLIKLKRVTSLSILQRQRKIEVSNLSLKRGGGRGRDLKFLANYSGTTLNIYYNLI